jgi:hypothetical protein
VLKKAHLCRTKNATACEHLRRTAVQFFQAKAQASAFQLQTSTACAGNRQRQAAQAGDDSMVKTFCSSGESEAVKGAVHALGGVLAASMAAYNIAAWCYRRETHLGINAIVYSLAIVWEAKQTVHHLERCEAAKPEAPRAA